MHSTVHSLRAIGHKVRVTHLRYGHIEGYSSKALPKGTVFSTGNFVDYKYSIRGIDRTDKLRDLDATFDPLGGMTVVDITLADGRTARGSATFARNENYNRKEGVASALDDALNQLGYVQPVYSRVVGVHIITQIEESFLPIKPEELVPYAPKTFSYNIVN